MQSQQQIKLAALFFTTDQDQLKNLADWILSR